MKTRSLSATAFLAFSALVTACGDASNTGVVDENATDIATASERSSVDPATQGSVDTSPAMLSVTAEPLTLQACGSSSASGALTITNVSSTATATNVASHLAGTELEGKLTESGNGCATLAPGASCTLKFTPGRAAASPSSFIIRGDNTNEVTATIQILALDIGQSCGGGIVLQRPSTGVPGKIVTVPSFGSDPLPQWSDTNTVVGASSSTDGDANTQLIIATLSPSSTAAQVCNLHAAIGADGVVYADWYLPADAELKGLLSMANAHLVSDFPDFYWTSTEVDANRASVRYGEMPNLPLKYAKTDRQKVACVRTFE